MARTPAQRPLGPPPVGGMSWKDGRLRGLAPGSTGTASWQREELSSMMRRYCGTAGAGASDSRDEFA